MYLPNAHYIPAPFKQNLKASEPTLTLSANPRTAQVSPQETAEIPTSATVKPDIIAAESSAKHLTHNDDMETALLLMLLMDGIR